VSTEQEMPPYTARLLIDCADQPGIVASVSGFLFEQGANIVSSHQYSSDPMGGRFYLRTEFFLDGLAEDRESFRSSFDAEVAERFAMEWKIRYWGERQRVAILVSRYDHCLMDLLWRWRRGELYTDMVGVVSNHADLAEEAKGAGVPFHHVPVAKGAMEQAEERMLELLRDQVDLVVLARYMQILSGDFLDRLGVPVINIHHSFLPAFAGAGPYERAKERGVKLIGATAHYATEDLDEGPIIEQDVVRVSHRVTARELTQRGADIERAVLARAVAWHARDRVLVNGRTTIIF
jgi:formyltetrahydrofolate deformylase